MLNLYNRLWGKHYTTMCSTHITTMSRLTFRPLFNKVRVHLVEYSSQLSLLTSKYANSSSIALRGFDPRIEGRNDTSMYIYMYLKTRLKRHKILCDFHSLCSYNVVG